jgi:phosphoribosylformylglycinamidine synthase
LFQEGIATAIGEQPIKGLVDASAGARMAVAESVTNLVFARISDIQVLMRLLTRWIAITG